MKQKFEKGSAEMNMFRDFYTICEAYWIAEPAECEDYWTALINDLDAFCKKHKAIQLASKLAITFENAKEREMKKME